MTGEPPGGPGRGAAAAVAPTSDDPVVRALSEGVGGPLGERAARHPWWTPTRVVLALTALCFALGMVQKAPCAEDGWRDGDQRYTAMCYSDLPYLYTGRGMAELAWPYSDDPQVRERHETMEYPVGISYWAYGTAWVTHWLAGAPDLDARRALPDDEVFGQPGMADETRLYVAVNAVGLGLLTLLAASLLTRVHPRRPWDAAAFAVSPALAVSGLINWDLLAVVCVAAALWAWARGRPGLAGVMIGLGTAVKLYPVLLLGGVVVLCLRRWHRGPVRPGARRAEVLSRTLVGAAVAWLLANAPAYLTGPEAWRVFWSFNVDRGPDLGSVWLVAAQAGNLSIPAETVNRVSLLAFGGWCLLVGALGLLAPQRPRLAQLAFLVLAGFLLVNKVYSPQYVLWLLPLAVLSRPRWRDQLIWQGSEVFYFAVVWWYLAGALAPGAGDDAGFYWIGIGVRVLGELWLVAVVARDVLRPRHDPVPRPPELMPPRPVPAAGRANRRGGRVS